MAESDPTDAVPAPLMPLCSVFRRYLKTQGLKYTVGRAEILQGIIEQEGPFEAEELLLDLRRQGQKVSKATVYRTLKLLQEAGIITQALFDSKQSHFQLIYGKEPRDVMICMRTGRTIDFKSPELEALRNRICEELGWEPVGHRFQVFAVSPESETTPVDSMEDED